MRNRVEGSDLIVEEAAKLGEFVTIAEALIFASESPLKEEKLAEVFTVWASENGDRESNAQEAVASAIVELNHRYAESGSSFRVRKVGGGYKIYTLPEFHRWISDFLHDRRPARLSPAALETLSIIAYRQPVVKSEIDNIRGVDSEGPLHSLLERGLIKTSGRRESPGRPYIFRTTPNFLAYFGLNDLSELPSEEELMSPFRASGVSPETLEGHEEFFKGATSTERAGVSIGQGEGLPVGGSAEGDRDPSASEPVKREENRDSDQGTTPQ